MDFIGILKEAWAATWRHRALWILGLFTAGSAGVSSFNWQTNVTQQDQGAQYDLRELEGFPQEMERVAREGVDWVEYGAVPDWLPWVLFGVAVLFVIGIGFWVLSIAAKGGIVAQTNEALAGRPVSARAGWRTGFGRWGRVFLVGLILALPALALLLVASVIVGGIAFLAIGATSVGPDGAWPALLGLGALVPVVILLLLVIAVVIGMIREVAYRRAILDDVSALDGVKMAWADLRAKRGLATMWLVMLVVGIGASVVTALVMVPVLIVTGLITAASYMSAGAVGLWILVPMVLIVIAVGALIKAVYATFFNAAWTSFYRRMTAPRQVDPGVQAPVPGAADAFDGAADAG